MTSFTQKPPPPLPSPSDPALRHLVADAESKGDPIPLTLYLPSGPIFGYLTPSADFGIHSTAELRRATDSNCVVAPKPDPEYAHLTVKELALDPGNDSESVVRVRLVDVVAWSVG